MAKKPTVFLSREEELRVLEARNEKIRKDPAYGFQLLQKAGIYDANGQLAKPYREEEPWPYRAQEPRCDG